MQVIWTSAALDDLDEIQDYIAQDSPIAAYKLTTGLIAQADKLLPSNPMIGRRGRAAGTRELVIPQTAYIIVYRVRDRVEILAVVHAARDWPGDLSCRT